MSPQEPAPTHTPIRRLRAPKPMWDAYERVCERIGLTRTDDLLDRMRERIREHGDDQDLADLEAAEAELTARRSRRGGRPKKG